MDTMTDINLIKVDKYGNPIEEYKGKTYSLKSFLYDIKRDTADLRLSIGICEEDESGELKWIQPNKIWVICLKHVYSHERGWHNEKVYYMGETQRNYKEINELLGYWGITSYNTYL